MADVSGGTSLADEASVALQGADAAQTVSLSRLAAGAKGSVTALGGGRGFLTRLADMGLRVGSRIEVVQTSGAAGGRVLILSGGARLAIGHGMADRIMVVPGASGPAAELTLSDLITGDMARILRLRGSGRNGIRQRLMDMGVMRGAEVRVERHAPLGDPVEITIKGYYLAIRLSEGRDISVERI